MSFTVLVHPMQVLAELAVRLYELVHRICDAAGLCREHLISIVVKIRQSSTTC